MIFYGVIICVDCTENYDIQFCQKVHRSHTMRHCFDCRNCTNCFACVGLRNQKEGYFILNKKTSEDEFNEVLCNPEKQKKVLDQLQALYLSIPRLYTNFINSENFSGSYIKNCKNVYQCWDVEDLEDCSYCEFIQNAKACLDVSFYCSTGTNELLYECEGVGHGAFEVKFSKLIWGGSSNVEYSYECFSSKNIFGCTGLKKSQYCILNKQYSKDEYFALRDQIIEQMKTNGEWGEFFPIELSPFGYNETVAQEYFPLTKEECISRGWNWRNEEASTKYSGQKYEIPDSITDVSDDILKAILECETCSKNYRLVKPELDFYQRQKLPIPHDCPNCRHKARMALRNPRRFFERECDKCEKDIQTTFAPERPEQVYCEACYLKAVN